GTGTSDGDNPKAIGSAQKAISIAQDVQGEVFGALTKSGAVSAAFSIPGQIAATALDFAKAKAEGASNAAAAVTAASGTVQSLSFGVMGAIAGFAIAGPVGAAVGAIAGGIAGGIYGGVVGGHIAGGVGLPLVVDLDGDRVDLIPLAQSTTVFCMDRAGFRESPGWGGAGDGLLGV